MSDCPASVQAVWDEDPAEGICPLCGEPAEGHRKDGDDLAVLFAEDSA